MAQVNLLTREAATWAGIENVTYGVAPVSMTRITPIAESFEFVTERAELENNDQRVYRHDYTPPVRGLKTGSAKFGYFLKPPAVALASAAVPATSPFGVLLKGCGMTEYANEGSTVEASPAPTTTSFTVAAGDGANFAVGSWILVDVGGALEPTRISAVASDALTLDIALSSAPSAAAVVYQCYNYYPDESNTSTLTLEHALAGNSNYQYRFSGCVGGFELALARGEIARANFDFKAATWAGPHALSLSATDANDGMGTPFAVRDATILLQTAATTTRTHFVMHSVALKTIAPMIHLPELGGTEGTHGVMYAGENVYCEATVRFRVDSTFDSGTNASSLDGHWYDQDVMQLAIMLPQGSALTKRWAIVDMPRCYFVGKPKLVVEGGRALYEATLRSTIRASSATAALRRPFVFSHG